MYVFDPKDVVLRDIDDFKFFERNNKAHPESQIDRIAASMQRFGAVQPVAVDAKGVLIYGTGRILAARKLGLAKYPAITLTHLSEQKVREYRIADNATAKTGFDDLSDFDLDSLVVELQLLQDSGSDLLDIGIPGDALEGILASGVPDLLSEDPPPVPNDAPPDDDMIEVKYRLDRETHERLTSLMRSAPGANPCQRLAAILSCVDTTTLGSL